MLLLIIFCYQKCFLILCYSLQWTSFHQCKALICHLSTTAQSFITTSRRTNQEKSTDLLLLSYPTMWMWTRSQEYVGTWYIWTKWQWDSSSIIIAVVVSQCTNWYAKYVYFIFLKLWRDIYFSKHMAFCSMDALEQ